MKSRLHKATKPSVHAGFQRYVETADGSSETGRYCAQSLLTSWMVVALMVSCSLIACAQTPADDKNAPPPLPKPEIQSLEVPLPPVRLKSLPRTLFMDQETFLGLCRHSVGGERHTHRKIRSHKPSDGLACSYSFQCRARSYGRCRRRNVCVGTPCA